jgi:hypothetical protein
LVKDVEVRRRDHRFERMVARRDRGTAIVGGVDEE